MSSAERIRNTDLNTRVVSDSRKYLLGKKEDSANDGTGNACNLASVPAMNIGILLILAFV